MNKVKWINQKVYFQNFIILRLFNKNDNICLYTKFCTAIYHLYIIFLYISIIFYLKMHERYSSFSVMYISYYWVLEFSSAGIQTIHLCLENQLAISTPLWGVFLHFIKFYILGRQLMAFYMVKWIKILKFKTTFYIGFYFS